jgi:hypothetical protein
MVEALEVSGLSDLCGVERKRGGGRGPEAVYMVPGERARALPS